MNTKQTQEFVNLKSAYINTIFLGMNVHFKYLLVAMGDKMQILDFEETNMKIRCLGTIENTFVKEVF